ncbi:MAG: protein kinase [Bacteroidota bacterium]|nr:protein kinase [Bacteroidota bacterium]
MIGQIISHYKILEKLGEGGMGIVYKAHDTKLDRDVALKFLPHYLTSDPTEKERFYHEARAAAALTHQNIAVVYEIGEYENPAAAGKQIFIAMEYVEGKTLKQLIEHEPLSTKKVLDIAIQVCDGLAAAHEKGIVHRDIKSENILITSKGQVKITDFGLAKLKGATKLTKAGSTLGTAAYMSPEQARGEEVDQRSDIFSFGVVLYEMLTTHLPFRGEHVAAIQYSIVNEEPQPLARFNEKVTDEIQHIVSKALEKDRDDRYQHIDDLLSDLRRERKKLEYAKATYAATSLAHEGISETRSKAKKKYFKYGGIVTGGLILLFAAYLLFFRQAADSGTKIPIAVIDFVNETNDKELDGLSGLLITDLEQSRRLEVLTRSRMFDILNKLKMRDVDHIDEEKGKAICANSNINLMAVGTVKKFGDMYTVDLKVIDLKTGKHVFAAKADRKGKESIPSLIDEVAERTRTELQEPSEKIQESNKKIADITTTNLEAYQHYFLGENLINKLKFNEATEEFRKAIAIDSLFGLAYYRLAYAIAWNIGTEELAKIPMHKAMSLIERIPERERYLVRSEYARIEQNMESSLAMLREMEKVYPNDKEMTYLIGDYSWHLGKFDDAIKYLEKVLSMDPNFERALQHLSWAYQSIKKYDKMLEIAHRYVSVSGSYEAYQLVVEACISLGKINLAFSKLKSAIELFPANYSFVRLLSSLYAYKGMYDDAEKELKTLTNEDQPVGAKRSGYGSLALFYPYLGKYKEAMIASDKSIELYLQLKDTSNAETARISKAIIMYNGWNNIEDAWKEAEKTFPNRNRIASGNYLGGLSLLQLYHGDYAQADSITKYFGYWHVCILSMIESAKRNCANAEVLADSALKISQQYAQIFVLYPLAECQYDAGYLDKTIISLKKLQSLHDFDNLVEARPIFYPKSFYIFGKVYEKKGDKKQAMENFRIFLNIWKNADKDLPDYIDAKKRLAKLEGIATR